MSKIILRRNFREFLIYAYLYVILTSYCLGCLVSSLGGPGGSRGSRGGGGRGGGILRKFFY